MAKRLERATAGKRALEPVAASDRPLPVPEQPSEAAHQEDEALGGEPPCMACLLDDDGLMPDAPRLVPPEARRGGRGA